MKTDKIALVCKLFGSMTVFDFCTVVTYLFPAALQFSTPNSSHKSKPQSILHFMWFSQGMCKCETDKSILWSVSVDEQILKA